MLLFSCQPTLHSAFTLCFCSNVELGAGLHQLAFYYLYSFLMLLCFNHVLQHSCKLLIVITSKVNNLGLLSLFEGSTIQFWKQNVQVLTPHLTYQHPLSKDECANSTQNTLLLSFWPHNKYNSGPRPHRNGSKYAGVRSAREGSEKHRKVQQTEKWAAK